MTNTGLQWNADRTRTAQQGAAPSLIEPVTGTVTLRGLSGRVRSVSAVALDGAGKAIGAPIVAKRTAGGVGAADRGARDDLVSGASGTTVARLSAEGLGGRRTKGPKD